MPEPARKVKSAWEDKFTRPTLAALRQHYSKPVSQLWDAARARLAALPGASESLEWQGIPWRWTLVFRTDTDETRPAAYLIPGANAPIMCVPAASDALTRIPVKKLSRFVREGLVRATDVGGTKWPTWELQNRTQLEDIVKLVEFKLTLLADETAGV